ncbi:MAG: hypothetical protein ACKOKC_02025 [Chthoniobacterales bacterium]
MLAIASQAISRAESPETTDAKDEFVLLPKDARCKGPIVMAGPKEDGVIGYWTGLGTSVDWDISHIPKGRYSISIEYRARDVGGELELTVGEKRTREKLRPTPGFNYDKQRLGIIEISGGPANLNLEATKITSWGYLMDLKKVVLKKVKV